MKLFYFNFISLLFVVNLFLIELVEGYDDEYYSGIGGEQDSIDSWLRRGPVNSNNRNSFRSYSINKYSSNKVSEKTFSRLSSNDNNLEKYNGLYTTNTFPTAHPNTYSTLKEDLNENDYYNYYGDNGWDCNNAGCYYTDESGETIYIEKDNNLDVSCNTDEFTCDPQAYEKICIKQNLVCDGKKQCPNGRDESSCGRPVVGYLSAWTVGSCSKTCGDSVRIDTRACVIGILYSLCGGSLQRRVSCPRPKCPTNSQWSDWKKGECSVTCGEGKVQYTRECLDGYCVGQSEAYIMCKKAKCQENGWSTWKQGVCSKTCGGGSKVDTRSCRSAPCPGSRVRTTSCNTQLCSVSPQQWGPWQNGRCSKSCGGGFRKDTRKCIQGACHGSSSRSSKCNTQLCPAFSKWTSGPCSKTCGGGDVVYSRFCLSGDCQGPFSKVEKCNTQSCPTEYSSWKLGKCSAPCGEGERKDIRLCVRGTCTESLERIVKCNNDKCPGPSQWGRWQPGPCSVSCGVGVREFIRKCQGGTNCKGNSIIKIDCNEGSCDEEPTELTSQWLPWSPWVPCSKTCGPGVQTKTRKCPTAGKCKGASTEKRACFRKHCSVPFRQWTPCSRSCGWGTQMKIPFSTTSDFRDCKVKDCPQETCKKPYYRRYGVRNHTCCDVSQLNSDVCGISSSQLGISKTSSRIVGGSSSLKETWPWMVGLVVNGMPWCGAALVDNEWVLTAAHCVVYGKNTTLPLSSIELKFGTIDLKDTFETNIWTQTSGVSEIRFKDYDFPRNDVALLRLTKPPVLNRRVQIICFPQGEVLPEDTNCVAAGWGRLKEGGKNPSTLQEVSVRLIPDDMCSIAYPKNFDSKIMTCSGRILGGMDTCQGDSGGPLMCQRCESCQWIVYGVVSFGEGCGNKFRPGVYAKINAYSDWINSVMMKPITSGTHSRCTSL